MKNDNSKIKLVLIIIKISMISTKFAKWAWDHLPEVCKEHIKDAVRAVLDLLG